MGLMGYLFGVPFPTVKTIPHKFQAIPRKKMVAALHGLCVGRQTPSFAFTKVSGMEYHRLFTTTIKTFALT